MSKERTRDCYALKYDFTFEISTEGKFTKEEIKKEGWGGSDAIMFASIIRGGYKAHEGELSVCFYSYDGQNNGDSIPGTEMFTIWGMLASHLIERSDVEFWQKDIAQEAFESIRKLTFAMKNDGL